MGLRQTRNTDSVDKVIEKEVAWNYLRGKKLYHKQFIYFN